MNISKTHHLLVLRDGESQLSALVWAFIPTHNNCRKDVVTK